MRRKSVCFIGLGVLLSGLVFTVAPVLAGGTETPAGWGNWVISIAGDTEVTATGGTTVVVESDAGIISTEGNGITLDSDGYTITNNGDIDAGNYGIVSGSNGHTVINNGTITGVHAAVSFCKDHGGDGDDALINNATGVINGYIEMGDGDDTVTLEEGSVVNDEISFGHGNDTLIVNGAAEVNNSLYFGKDNDTLVVTEGTFAFTNGINMGSGNDTITIAAGATFTFDDESDVMAADDDTFNIYGTVNGYLAGGPDADTFNFFSGAQVKDNICGGNSTANGEDLDTLNLVGYGTYDYSAAHFEFLNKTGEGTWILTGSENEGYVGEIQEAVTISGGTLQIDGELDANALAVLSGGTLGGSGTVTGPVTNDGSVNPGASIGTLTIDGDYTQSADGDLTVNVNADDADLLDVTGTAIIDGSLTVIPTSDIVDGASYTILTAGTLVVEFAELIENSALLNFTLGYVGNTVQIHAEHSSELVSFAQNSEQAEIASQFDALLEAGTLGEAATFLYSLSEGQIPQALEAVSPVQYCSLADATSAGSSVYRSALTGRMSNMHLAFGQTPQTDAVASNALTEYGPALARLSAFDRDAKSWSSWVQVLGQTADQDGSGSSQGFEFDTYGLSLGLDNELNDNLVVGFSAGILDTDIDFDRAGQSGDIETYHFGFYGTYSIPKLYVDMALTYSTNDYESKRSISLADVTAKGDTDGNEYTAYVGLGYNLIEEPNWYLIPTLSLQYSRVDIDSFTEKEAGALNLSISDYDSHSVVSTLGGRIGMITTVAGMKLEPKFSLEWAHEYGNTDRDVKARFAGTTGAFTVDGIEPGRDSLLVGVGVNLYANEKLTVGVDYNGEFRSDFDAHQVNANLRFNF